MRARRPLTLLATSLVPLAASCLPGGKLASLNAPPPPLARSAPPPLLDEPAPPDEGPLTLLSSSPQGDEVEEPLPTFVFSRAMHRLGAPPDEPRVVATIDPPVEGHWRWMGSRALQFAPRRGFDRARRYRVTLAPGLSSLDGQRIEGPLSLDFATPRLAPPEVDFDATRRLLTLSFEMEVDPQQVRRAVRLVDEQKRAVEVQVQETRPSSRLHLKLPASLPTDESLRLVLTPPVVPIDGTLGLVQPWEHTVHEREPTRVEQISCGTTYEDPARCDSRSTLDVSLSAPLRPSDFRALVRFEPPVAFKLVGHSPKNEPVSYFTIEAPFREKTSYRVQVRSSPVRRRGQPGLDQGATFAFQAVPAPADVELLAHGTYVRPEWTREITATVQDVAHATFSATPLGLEQVVQRWRDQNRPRDHDEPEEEHAHRPALPRGGASLAFDDPGGKQAWAPVPLASLMPASPGPVWLSIAWQGRRGEGERSHELQRTDLALSSRLSPETSSFVWLTSLSSGQPVAQGQVTVFSPGGARVSAKTDEQGMAALDLTSLYVEKDGQLQPSAVLIVGQKGDDWLYLPARLPRQPSSQGALFSDRGVYRPGETIHFKGVVRQHGSQGLHAPAERDVQLEVTLPDGSPLHLAKKLSAWGTFDHELTLSPGSPPRAMHATLKHHGQTVAWMNAEVRHVRPESFRVETSLDRAHYLAGDRYTCSTRASYLYGGSLQNGSAVTEVVMASSHYQVPGLERYEVGVSRGYGQSKEGARKETLSAEGTARYEGRLGTVTDGVSRRLSCAVTVSEVGMQSRTGTADAWVHPAEVYPAVKRDPKGHQLEPGRPFEAEVLAVTPQGERRAARVALELRAAAHAPDETPPVLSSCTVITGPEATRCSLAVPDRYGVSYRVTALTTDAQGRTARTEMDLRTRDAPSRLEPVVKPEPARPPPPPPLLKVDQPSYRAGEQATVTLQPQQAFSRGLFVVQREGVLSRQLFDPETRRLTVPTHAAMAPGVRLTAMVVHSLSTDIPYDMAPRATEQGMTSVQVEGPERRLRVQVKPARSEAAPGQDLGVSVDVHDEAGHGVESEVTLYAVDEGMLMLSDYRRPELLERFLLRGEDLVVAQETRDRLGWFEHPVPPGLGRGAGTGQGYGFGSGHGRLGGSHATRLPALEKRKDFRPTPLFLPTLVTDAQGHAQTSFKLPDSLTSYRLMAVAVARGDGYGGDEANVTVRLPVQIRPALPLGLRAGDRFAAAAVAANNTDRAIDAVVSLAGVGFLLDADARRTVHLAPGASERVTFSVAAPRAGSGSLTFSLASEGGQDSAETPLEVTAPRSLEASAVTGQTAASVLEPLADLSRVRPDVGQLDVTVSTSAIGGLAPGLEQLVEYPYGCTEQLTSRLVPLLSLRDLARALGVALPADVDQASQRAVEAILRNRHADGQFGLWPGSEPTPWVTAYAYGGLAEARRRGLAVSDEVLRDGEKRLVEVALRASESEDAAAEASFALEALSELPGLDPTVRSHALILARQVAGGTTRLAVSGRAALLQALVRLGAERDEVSAQVRALESAVQLTGNVARVGESGLLALLDSPARSSALTLRALLLAAPTHPLIEPLARGLVADRGPRGWRTTQETAWALRALDAYRRAREGEVRDVGVRVTAAGRIVLDARLEGPAAERRGSLTMADLLATPGGVLVEATGGTAHYEARLRYAPRAMPTEPVMAGMEITKECRPLVETSRRGHEHAPATTFSLGQWVRCELTVSTPARRRYVVIEDPVPSGFDVIDPSLQGVPPWVRSQIWGQKTEREIHPGRVATFLDSLSAGAHSWSYVARAVTAGQFVVPPTRVEEMYTPETFAQTAGGEVVVIP